MGYFEIAKPADLNAEQTDMVKRHLALVFKHEIDPSMPDPTGELQATHDGKIPLAPNLTYCATTSPPLVTPPVPPFPSGSSPFKESNPFLHGGDENVRC